MKIIQDLDQTTTLRTLTAEELALGVQVLRTNLGYQPGESVLIVTDDLMSDREAAVWFEAAKTIDGARVRMLVLRDMHHSGEEPPEKVVAACADSDITFLHTSFSLTHTQAGKMISAHGHRGASLPTVDHEMMMRTLTIDYAPIQKLGTQLQTLLNQATTLHITSANGTRLELGVRQGHIFNDGGIVTNGEVNNLPAGEVFFAPLVGSTQGTLVIDGAVADDKLDRPIAMTIENGVAVSFEGGFAARDLEKKLRAFGHKGLTVAELGIGTNPATHPTGSLIEAEKAYGTIHMAFGNSSAMGGENNVPIHIDGVVVQPKVIADEKIILENGTFTL
jgi:leucyl aminopeptidase (aminopeptidase T)